MGGGGGTEAAGCGLGGGGGGGLNARFFRGGSPRLRVDNLLFSDMTAGAKMRNRFSCVLQRIL